MLANPLYSIQLAQDCNPLVQFIINNFSIGEVGLKIFLGVIVNKHLLA